MRYVMFALVAIFLGVFLPVAPLDAAQSPKPQTIVLPDLARLDLPSGFDSSVQDGYDHLWGPSLFASYLSRQSNVESEIVEIDSFPHVKFREQNSPTFRLIERPLPDKQMMEEKDIKFATCDCSAYLYNEPFTVSSKSYGRVEYRLFVYHLQDVVTIHIWTTSRVSSVALAESAAKNLAEQMSRSWRWTSR